MGMRGRAVVEEALHLPVGARLVSSTVRERELDPERVPGPAAVKVAPEELERGHVRVGVDRARHGRRRTGAAERLAGGVHAGLGVDRAAAGRREADGHGGARAEVGHRVAARGVAVHLPDGVSGRAGGRHSLGAEEVTAVAVDQVLAQRGGLHRKGGVGGGQALTPGSDRETAVDERVAAGRRPGTGRRWVGDGGEGPKAGHGRPGVPRAGAGVSRTGGRSARRGQHDDQTTERGEYHDQAP